MAGGLTISTLNDSSGVLATQNGMSGIAKAWVNFNGTGTVAIRASFNVSSITDLGTGYYRVNFTTSMPDANYSVVASSSNTTIVTDTSGYNSGCCATPYSTSAANIVAIVNSTTNLTDAESITVAVYR